MGRIPFLLLVACLAACGGGGDGGPPAPAFKVAGTVPQDGSVGVTPESAISITFSDAADLSTVTAATVQLRRRNGTLVPFDLFKQAFNPGTVQVRPLAPLEENEIFQLTVKGQIRSTGGKSLGADRTICFATASRTPTVRPDQVIDLGDRLNVPRYLAQAIRLKDGRFAVIGGFTDTGAATDRIEIWNPATRGFELQAARLIEPRAEFTATVLADGSVLLAGGVSQPGGEPLATTEFLLPGGSVVSGPPLNRARRWHAASGAFGASLALVSGGFDGNGEFLGSIEALQGGQWVETGTLPEPSAQHLQVALDGQSVYFTAGNYHAKAARFSGLASGVVQEGDIRFRTAAQVVDGDRILVVAGDTRSVTIHDFSESTSWLASALLRDRRGAYALTARGENLFLAAGGHQLSNGDAPLDTLEIVEYLPSTPAGRPDAAVYPVENVRLPVPMAGLVAFKDNAGEAVLAGGMDRAGNILRRVVLILDDPATPTPSCTQHFTLPGS